MEIDLTKVKTVCISMKSSIIRRANIQRLMNNIGFQNWSFFDGIEDSDPVIGCAKSHVGVLKSHDFSEPLLVLEDDVEVTDNFKTLVKIPQYADAVYLGYSWWAWEDSRAKMSFLDKKTELLKSGEWYKISNMTSAHAVLYLTKEYADRVVQEVEDYLKAENSNRHCDVAMAKIQKEFNVFAPSKHLFFQVCPRNTYWTNRSIA